MGIISTVMAPIITRFVDAYDAQTRRGGLVERAQVTLNRITREVHLALPNSIRVDSGTAMEMIRTIDGGRYRSTITAPGETFLDTTAPDDGTFDVLGKLNDCPGVNTLAGGGNIFLTMMNGLAGSGSNLDIYQGQNLATITGCTGTATALDPEKITFTPTAWTFPGDDDHRFQIVDTPVSYICTPDAANPQNGKIVRYHGYTIDPFQPTTDAAVDGLKTANYSHDVLVDKVAACEFSFNTGNGLFTVSITIQDENTNDVIRLMQQVHIENPSS